LPGRIPRPRTRIDEPEDVRIDPRIDQADVLANIGRLDPRETSFSRSITIRPIRGRAAIVGRVVPVRAQEE